MMTSPREAFEQQYKAASAEGAIIELRLRLLADKVPELQKYAHDQRLENVETLVVQHFAGSISEEEKTVLELCRQLRNKILHCDFRAARQKLEQIGFPIQRGNVKKIDVRGLSGAQMKDKITAAVAAHAGGTFEYVADTTAGPGTVFGWLMEVGSAGDFIQAAKAFARGAEIIDRLALG